MLSLIDVDCLLPTAHKTTQGEDEQDEQDEPTNVLARRLRSLLLLRAGCSGGSLPVGESASLLRSSLRSN